MKRHLGAARVGLALLLLPMTMVVDVDSDAQQPSVGETIYQLHGAVVNEITGKPVARALVESSDQRLAVMTDNEGRFAIDLAASPAPALSNGASGFYLKARRPGYLPAEQNTLVAINGKLSTTEFRLRLMPAATVSGHVSAAKTDSVDNIRVTLMRRQVDDDGRLRWMQAGSQSTNSRGEYRFDNLAAGEYTVMIPEWKGDQPVPPQTAESKLEVTEQYPPMYLGDASSLAGAARLHLRYGDAAQADMYLHRESYYPVIVPVPSDADVVEARVMDDNGLSGFTLTYNRSDRAVEGVLPSGQYNLLLSSQELQPRYAILPVHVYAAPVRTAVVALAPAGTITVRVSSQLTHLHDSQPGSAEAQSGEVISGQASLVQVTLQPDAGLGNAVGGTHEPGKDEFTLKNVQPGRYFVHAQAFQGYVASISSGGVDLALNPLVVDASGTAELIEITLRDDGPTITGTVAYGSDPPKGCAIILLSTSPGGQVVRTFAGPDGMFTATNLAPGGYRVLALRNLKEQIPYRDAEAMQRYDGKGTTVQAGAGEQVHVDVTLQSEAEAEDR